MPNCGKIVFCPTITGISSVVCSCGYNFCFLCGEEGHKPCTCKEVKAWTKKCSDDSETANFIVSRKKRRKLIFRLQIQKIVQNVIEVLKRMEDVII